MSDTPECALANPDVVEAMARGFIEIRDARVQYNLNQKKTYNWNDPEEWVRARVIAFLIVSKNYPAHRIRTEVKVPRRTPQDRADIVVYVDDGCSEPFVVAEVKAADQSQPARNQAIEQLFGNANSLRAPFALYEEEVESFFFDVKNFPPTERKANRRGGRSAVPSVYGQDPFFVHDAGSSGDIKPARPAELEARIRRSHSIIWAGGKRDPLLAFDEWSKLLFAKVVDERTTPTGAARAFQVGTRETATAVANRVHRLFLQGCQDDRSIFPLGTRINLIDRKICDVVSQLQSVSLMGTDVDAVGSAFENFFGSVFRGELGQYFTMRQIARFTVAMLDITHKHFVIDPTAGSGGFLLETLLQVWHSVSELFKGQSPGEILRIKTDFALRVFGIEIHEILARICKINLLLHHDGHTNIESDRSCLDSAFSLSGLRDWKGKFHRVVGNPPFGDEVVAGDEDSLGSNHLDEFAVARKRDSVPSEHVIVERAIDMLQPNGCLGLVLPDGLLNNQGELSNCPRMRAFLASMGQVTAIISLPDFAFRKSGAQNKTSLLFFRKFSAEERLAFRQMLKDARASRDATPATAARATDDEEPYIGAIYRRPPFCRFRTFLAEANAIGYTPAGALSRKNDLYHSGTSGSVDADQAGTILGEWRAFSQNPARYAGHESPDCISVLFADLWDAHPAHRIDPKYHLFKRTEHSSTPPGWIRVRIRDAMQRREEEIIPATHPDRSFLVMTISQTGEIRPREPGKGHNPPEWRGMYFENASSRWFQARRGDVIYSSIDLWKGCIAVVPPEFDGAIATSEFPILDISDPRLDAEFLSYLLRSQYYQRAFRAITTGHSNRRRTQASDFDDLEICFPADMAEQRRIVAGIQAARRRQKQGAAALKAQMAKLSEMVDGNRRR
jgi:type I restriction enzyme M protein